MCVHIHTYSILVEPLSITATITLGRVFLAAIIIIEVGHCSGPGYKVHVHIFN